MRENINVVDNVEIVVERATSSNLNNLFYFLIFAFILILIFKFFKKKKNNVGDKMEGGFVANGKAIALVAILAIFLTVATSLQQASLSSDSIKSVGRVCLLREAVLGNEEIGCFKNVVTNLAKNQTRDVRAGFFTNPGAWKYLALSSSSTTPSETEVSCPSIISGYGPVAGTVSIVSGQVGNYSTTYKFTASGTITVSKVCLTNSTDTTNNLMASALISPSITLNAGENLTVTYYIAEQ